MSVPRYSIGIDLGTTNCALAFVDLAGAGESQSLPIVQKIDAHTEGERGGLPSFLYWHEEGRWEVGHYARERAREQPDRVIHSAKSWLCHHAVSPESKILPWKSAVVGEGEKLSAIEASAQLLSTLKSAWQNRFGAEAPFEQQQITITVPASFDLAAQSATRRAAELAGYPTSCSLLEEPQAAFHRWLEAAGGTANLIPEDRLLVVDLGGGTADFSVFEVDDGEATRPTKLRRVAVSDHLLLGGDNIDLALAHALESVLAPDGKELSADQWGFLLGVARTLKEQCLSGEGDEQLAVAIPGSGSGLLAGTLSAEISSEQVREMLLQGFFPACRANAKAERAAGGLLEWGLPYAVDCALTHHLAEFLADKGKISRVLFNGGSLIPPVLRERLLDQIKSWQGGCRPVELSNPEPDLAVARGAAVFGAERVRGARSIEAGAARACFLEVDEGSERRLVCVLPEGGGVGIPFVTQLDGLRLRLNQRVAFRAFQANGGFAGAAGELVSADRAKQFKAMPPLEAEILDEGENRESSGSIAVRLVARVSESGLLEISCEAIEGDGRWPLEFNLRSAPEQGDLEESSVASSDEVRLPKRLDEAKSALRARLLAGEKASRIFKELEGITGQAKHEWSASLSRELLEGCLAAGSALERGDAAVESWLQLSGYLMRPGFGVTGDDERLERLQVCLKPLTRLSSQTETQCLIFWRRVAAGLSEAEQSRLFAEEIERLKETDKASAERMRLLGALEKLDLSGKRRLFQYLLERLETALEEEGYISPILEAFARLASRCLFHAGPDRVLPPEDVHALYKKVSKLDWRESRFSAAVPLFLSAARIMDERSLNLPGRLQAKVIRKLEKSGVASARLGPLRDFVPISRKERDRSFGESLPSGLRLEK